MARHLDLEEQEQLDQLRHFWNRWGNLITWVLIVVLGTFAAWNGWQFWQRRQAVQASVLYDEVDRAAAAGDAGRVQQAFKDIQENYGGTTYAKQAGLLAAKALADQGQTEAARSVLQWVAAEGEGGYEAVARLRLAALLAAAQSYDQALQQLAAAFPAEFQPLAADRRGDIYRLQGKRDEARAEYARAWQGLPDDVDYRTLLEAKLTALGVDLQSLQGGAAAAGGARS